MADPDNHTLRLLREIRVAVAATSDKVDALNARITDLDSRMERNDADLGARIDRLRQAMTGESVLGRYAVAGVEERLDSLEQRVTRIEDAR